MDEFKHHGIWLTQVTKPYEDPYFFAVCLRSSGDNVILKAFSRNGYISDWIEDVLDGNIIQGAKLIQDVTIIDEDTDTVFAEIEIPKQEFFKYIRMTLRQDEASKGLLEEKLAHIKISIQEKKRLLFLDTTFKDSETEI